MTKVLMISGDAGALDSSSAVHARLHMMADVVDSLTVFVRAPTTKNILLGERNMVCGFGGSKMQAARAMLRAAGETPCDLVTAQDPFWLGLIGWLAARQARVPLQLQVHTDIFSPAYRRASLGNRVRFYLARFLLRRAGCVRVVSERIGQSLRATGIIAPISVLPIFIDAATIADAVPADIHKLCPNFSRVLLVAARLEKEKQVDLLLRAMPDILKKVPDAGLLIAGDGSQRRALERLAAQLSVADRVVFLGRRADIFSLYKSVDAVLAATASYEGYGASTVEALAAGAPVVSLDIGIARDAGAIIAADRASIAAAAVYALESNAAGSLHFSLPTREQWVAQWKGGLCA